MQDRFKSCPRSSLPVSPYVLSNLKNSKANDNIGAQYAVSLENLSSIQREIMRRTKILYGRPVEFSLTKILYEISLEVKDSFDILEVMNERTMERIIGWLRTLVAEKTRQLTWDKKNQYRPQSGGVIKFDPRVKLRDCSRMIYPTIAPRNYRELPDQKGFAASCSDPKGTNLSKTCTAVCPY